MIREKETVSTSLSRKRNEGDIIEKGSEICFRGDSLGIAPGSFFPMATYICFIFQ